MELVKLKPPLDGERMSGVDSSFVSLLRVNIYGGQGRGGLTFQHLPATFRTASVNLPANLEP